MLFYVLAFKVAHSEAYYNNSVLLVVLLFKTA